MEECKTCGHALKGRQAFCPKCGELTSKVSPLASQVGAGISKGAENLAGRFSSLKELVTAGENRKKVISIGAVFVLLLTALTDNPLSNGISSLVRGEPDGPQLTAEGLPDFATYEDVFLSEEAEFIVMSTANVRDFPTSQGTNVVQTFSGGEVVRAQEVMAFDPTSQWFKLAGGGYVWGRNLESLGQIAHEAGYSFPREMEGSWSDKDACAGLGRDSMIEVRGQHLRFGPSLYELVAVEEIENQPVYSLVQIDVDASRAGTLRLDQDTRWPVLWLSFGEDLTGKQFRYFNGQTSCQEVDRIVQQMQGAG